MKERCLQCGASARWMRNGRCRVCGNHSAPSAMVEPWRALLRLPGISSEIAQAMYALGLHTVEDVRNASDEVLLSVPGIGPVRAAKIRGLILEK